VSDLKGIVTEIAVSIEESTVTIELICADAYAAEVLCDDIVSRVSSGGGLQLNVRATPKVQGASS
jgi:hypothetical protein